METRNRLGVAVPLMAAMCGFALAAPAQGATYAGNGATGFGGPVGKGSLSVTDDGSGNITFTLNTSSTHPSGLDGNNLVIYLSTGAPGLADTSSLTDDGDAGGTAMTVDNGREAISGYNDDSPAQGNPQTGPGGTGGSRAEIAFPTGFAATYAFSFANAYDGLFRLPTLPTDTPGGLIYVDGAAPVNNLNTVTIPLAELGLTQGQSVSFVASDIDGSSAYRSNEAIGDATVNGTPTSLTAVSNPGFNNLITFTDFDTYNTTTVPEPASLGAAVLGAIAALFRRRRRSSR
jgi:hypothetical protein